MRILYAAGPGNVLGTYRYFLEGQPDPGQIAITYSSQFFELCRELGVDPKVVTTFPEQAHFTDGKVQIENWVIPWTRSGGIRYRLGNIWYLLRLMVATLMYRAEVAVVAETCYWYILDPLRLFSVTVIPTIHCVLWKTHEPITGRERLLWKANGWFFRHCVAGVMCVSDDIARQVHSLLRGKPLPVISFIPTYLPDTFRPASSETASREMVKHPILYVGRVEAAKGVFDLVEIARELDHQGRTDVCFEICGVGSALEDLKRAVAEAGLSNRFRFHGYLGRSELAPMYQSAFVVIVPTRTSFVEGFNKVVAEGILARKPVITSPVCPAVEYFGEGVVLVPPNNVGAYASAILRLIDDPAFYKATIEAAEEHRAQLYDQRRGWGATLNTLLSLVTPAHGKSAEHATLGQRDLTRNPDAG